MRADRAQREAAEAITPVIERALRAEPKPISIERAQVVVSEICEDMLGPSVVYPIWVEQGPAGLKLIVRFS